MTWKHSEWNPGPRNRTWNLYKCPATVWILSVKNFYSVSQILQAEEISFFFFSLFSLFRISRYLSKLWDKEFLLLNTVNSNVSPGWFFGGEAQRWMYSVGSIRMNAPGSFCGRCHRWRGGSILPSAICLRGEEEHWLAARFPHEFSAPFFFFPFCPKNKPTSNIKKQPSMAPGFSFIFAFRMTTQMRITCTVCLLSPLLKMLPTAPNVFTNGPSRASGLHVDCQRQSRSPYKACGGPRVAVTANYRHFRVQVFLI